MLNHTGSARDPLPSKPNSSSSSTPGLGWVVAGFIAICVAVAVAQGGWLQHSVAQMASACRVAALKWAQGSLGNSRPSDA